MRRVAARLRVGAWVLGWAGLTLAAGCGDRKAPPTFQVYTAWPFDAAEAKRRQQETARSLGLKAVEEDAEFGNGVKMTMVLIPAGRFTIGSPPNETDRPNNEGQKQLTMGKPFWIGKYEVTQDQWEAVMGSNPSEFKGAKNPVEAVSWNDIHGFLQKLNARAGSDGFALPTEAQWEYACRAGTSTRFCSGDDYRGLGEYAWHGNNSQGTPHPVGQKTANAWGLHDTHGNVWEWCSSPYSERYDGSEQKGAEAGGNLRVLRGGSWYIGPWFCPSARRSGDEPMHRSGLFGFRVIRAARTSE